jgi:integrase
MNTRQTLILLFRLNKQRSKNGKNVIYLRIKVNQNRSEFSTGQYVDENCWDHKQQRVNARHPDATNINRILDVIRSDIQRHFSLIIARQEHVTADAVKNVYLGIKEKEYTLCEAFEMHNRRFAEKVKAGNKSSQTLKRLEITKQKIISFLKYRYKRSDIALKDIKFSLAPDLEHFFTTVQMISGNTAMKYIKILKQVIKMSVENGWLANNPLSGFKCTYEEPERDRLTMEELMIIYNKDLDLERLIEVRDIYLFCCFTGFAYLDVHDLTPENIIIGIDGEKWISKNRTKTKSPERVPLLPIALDIIEKYKNNRYCLLHNKLLPVNSNQRFNSYLKELACICGINKHLTTHTARHTFATTVTLENDVPLETVSQMLGHRSIRTTQIYAKITQKKISNNMNELKRKGSV